MNLTIYRGADVYVTEIPILDSFIFSRSLMQEHRITASNLVLPAPLAIQLNDYIMYKGIKYTINTVPDVLVNHQFTYNIVFEGPEYTLYDKLFLDEGSADFPYFGTAQEQLLLLLENINEIDPGWTIGVVDETEPIFIDYVNLSCRLALSAIAEKFGLEYYFDNKQINLVKQAGNVTTLSFEYGMDNGLYSLTRKYVSEKNVKTKVYGFGGTRNLPEGYRGMANPRLTFEERFITRNTDIYGVKEAQFTDEEIFPSREAPITGASVIVDDDSKTFTITDTTLDFNINDYKLSGLEWKIQFTTGDLTGEEFVIKSYDNTTKTLTLNKKVNSSNIKLPSEAFHAEVGNKYVLLDIGLPVSYVEAAELEVKNSTTEYTDQNAIPRVEFELAMDILFVKQYSVELTPGDKVQIINASLGIDDQIRVTSVNYPISFPEVLNQNTKYNVTIANFIAYDIRERLPAAVIENRKTIKVVDRRSVELARRNTANFHDLQDLIFDPDDYFDMGNIKPGSIETGLLSIGVKSQNFKLKDVVFEFNLGGDPNSVYISNGTLEHLAIEIPTLGYSWVIPGHTFTGLDAGKPYYIYAECSTTALTGEWKISETPVKFEDVPGKYIFNLGILYKVNGGYRDEDMTYGTTTVVGQNINTGRVQDITHQNYFDLIEASFNLGDDEQGINFNTDGLGNLFVAGNVKIKGGIATGTLNVGDETGVNNAGITGIIDNASESVWLWGGDTYANRDTAPFRALQDGTVYMTKARISGDIIIGFQSESTSEGFTSGWKLSSSAILNDAGPTGTVGGNNFALIRGSSKYDTGAYTEFAFATDLVPATSGGAYAQTGYIRNKRPELGTTPGFDDTTNIALELHASGANKNLALIISSGGIELPGGELALTGIMQLSEPLGSRYMGARLVSGIVVELGNYIYASNPPLPSPNR